MLKCQNKCKIVGIDTDQPVIQVDRCVFAGEYEGLCFILWAKFYDSGYPEAEDKPLLKYKCHTAKKLLMKRTFLSDKEGDESAGYFASGSPLALSFTKGTDLESSSGGVSPSTDTMGRERESREWG
uniref:Transcription factor TFIIIC triple barrel domain-containing protein n=1 Tax=Callorhinchus milii TaxID=7868 RepID=A0A4W3GMW9_CALMI